MQSCTLTSSCYYDQFWVISTFRNALNLSWSGEVLKSELFKSLWTHFLATLSLSLIQLWVAGLSLLFLFCLVLSAAGELPVVHHFWGFSSRPYTFTFFSIVLIIISFLKLQLVIYYTVNKGHGGTSALLGGCPLLGVTIGKGDLEVHLIQSALYREVPLCISFTV